MPAKLFDQLPDELKSDPHLTLFDFAGRVGNRLGYGWGPHNGERPWVKKQQLDIAEVVGMGQRMAYKCVGLPREMGQHSWSFLRPTRTFVMAEGDSEFLLPEDSGPQIEGPVVIVTESGTETPIRAVSNWAAIRAQRAANPTFTGSPTMVAVEPMERAGTGPQRYRLILWPTLDRAYTVRVNCRVIEAMLTEARPYHYGSAQFSDLFQAGIYYAAELLKDNQYQGPMMGNYIDTLVASVDLDRRTWPKHLGFNVDTSDARWAGRQYYRVENLATLTVSGIVPE